METGSCVCSTSKAVIVCRGEIPSEAFNSWSFVSEDQ